MQALSRGVPHHIKMTDHASQIWRTISNSVSLLTRKSHEVTAYFPSGFPMDTNRTTNIPRLSFLETLYDTVATACGWPLSLDPEQKPVYLKLAKKQKLTAPGVEVLGSCMRTCFVTKLCLSESNRWTSIVCKADSCCMAVVVPSVLSVIAE